MLNRRDLLKLGTMTLLSPMVMPFAAASERAKEGGRRRVIVIGAGLAGLAAAWELDHAGYDVVVLEAQMRAGGRVRTLRAPFSDDLHAEAGAMSISDVDTVTLDYVKRFELPLQQPNLAAPRRFRVRGRWITDPMNTPYELNAAERELGLRGMYGRYVAAGMERLGDVRSAEWTLMQAREMDDLTVAAFLRRQGASDDAIEFLRLTALGLYGDGIDSSSALGVYLAESGYKDARASYAIEGGNDRLPKAFARSLADKIHYGCAVTRLAQSESAVEVTATQSGVPFSTSADYVISAVPATMLRTIKTVPDFSAKKRQGIRDLAYSSVSRVYLQSRKRVWQKYHPTAVVHTDSPRMIVEEHTAAQPGPRGIIESHTFGVEARAVAASPESDRIRAAVRLAEALFPGMEKEVEGGTTVCWDEDLWARGAYADWRPGRMTAHFESIRSPEGRIHFAGEHTSRRYASMEGALESGKRAVTEILARRG